MNHVEPLRAVAVARARTEAVRKALTESEFDLNVTAPMPHGYMSRKVKNATR